LEREWIEIGEDGFRRIAPAKLPAERSEDYAFGRNTLREYVSNTIRCKFGVLLQSNVGG
jgi:hypothetical protein